MNGDRWMEFLHGSEQIVIEKLTKQDWQTTSYSYMDRPRPNHGLLFSIFGEIKFKTETETILVRKGDVIFLPKHARYEAIIDDAAQDYLINFDLTGRTHAAADPIKLLKNAPSSFADKLAAITEEKSSATVSALRIQGLACLLIDEVINFALTNSNSKEGDIEKAIQLLTSEQEPKITEIAHRCGMSTSGLRLLFREKTGISPSEYRLQFKINKARTLLESTSFSVKHIANMLHFYDEAYFCKVFKQRTGKTPTQYAQNKQL